jgi:rhamnosyltransferase
MRTRVFFCSGESQGGVRTASRQEMEILLPTYNAGSFLTDQIASIEAQTYPAWLLLCQDNGSSDGTAQLLRGHERRMPDRIRVLPEETRPAGAAAAFYSLMRASDAEYLALCDQDDVWTADHLALGMFVMRALEAKIPNKPILVATDLTVTGSDVRDQRGSFWHINRINPLTDVEKIIYRNIVTGCTATLNKPLRDEALRHIDVPVLHDHLLGATAAAKGVLAFVGRPTVMYRQHGGNSIGSYSGIIGTIRAAIKNLRRSISAYRALSSVLGHRFQLRRYVWCRIELLARLMNRHWTPDPSLAPQSSNIPIVIVSDEVDSISMEDFFARHQ